mmetsp:Transcript_1431/g.3099  ORF Transcript_1431/g.3099 Transcript_1431/m.3099 type:complete len:210 (-) Transcript_1431:196-825(-)
MPSSGRPSSTTTTARASTTNLSSTTRLNTVMAITVVDPVHNLVEIVCDKNSITNSSSRTSLITAKMNGSTTSLSVTTLGLSQAKMLIMLTSREVGSDEPTPRDGHREVDALMPTPRGGHQDVDTKRVTQRGRYLKAFSLPTWVCAHPCHFLGHSVPLFVHHGKDFTRCELLPLVAAAAFFENEGVAGATVAASFTVKFSHVAGHHQALT